jgi:hypothetical protein
MSRSDKALESHIAALVGLRGYAENQAAADFTCCSAADTSFRSGTTGMS